MNRDLPTNQQETPTHEKSVEAIESILELATKGEVYTTLSIKLEDMVTRRRTQGCAESKFELSALLDALQSRETELVTVDVTQDYHLADQATFNQTPSAKGIDFEIVVKRMYGE